MVPRLTPGFEMQPASPRPRRAARRVIFEIASALLVCVLFCLKITNYADADALRWPVISQTAATVYHDATSAVGNLPLLNSCPRALQMAEISGGYVCAQPGAVGAYADIYKSYPLVGKSREVIYTSTAEGSVPAANDLLQNVYDVPRYRPVRLPARPTWSEDPYSARYWRFEFYSLRPSLNLLYAFQATGQAAYARRLVSLDLSFIAAEPKSRWAWSDPHAAAFRCMSLVDTWWKLRQAHILSEPASTAILRELEKTGAFLANPDNYQVGENHGTNEAAALYNLAVAFPSLPNAHQWLLLAEQRFEWQLKGIIDADGQLIENSPYYDFYTLEKYWEIYQYMNAQHMPPPDGFAEKLQSMLNFATYILQPNSQLPLLGASLGETVNDFGVYAKMAATDPTLLYVLTRGARGTAPVADSKFFPASELTVMRSGWQPGPAYTHSTYLTYNIGRYRTKHSDLDALGITLYGDGGDLLPDPGLYTYLPGPYRDYFHGTESHNDVTVDGKSQFQGDGIAGKLTSTDGITYQAGESSLYDGVEHRRMVLLFGADHVLVVDQLQSADIHTYRQNFHLFPSAQLRKSGLTVSGTGGTPRRQVTIQQLAPGGLSESSVINQRGRHPAGLCSTQYGKLTPCYQITYTARARSAVFVTLLTIGRPHQMGFGIHVTTGHRFRVTFGGRHLTLALGRSAPVAARAQATDPTPPPVPSEEVAGIGEPSDWVHSGGITPPAAAQQHSSPGPAAPALTASGPPEVTMVNDSIRLNLLRHNARLTLKVTGLKRITELQLTLSNDNWAGSATASLLDTDGDDETGGQESFFVGRSGRVGPYGGWQTSAPRFSWSHIDGMKITIEAKTGSGPPPTVTVEGLTLLPAQEHGKVVFIFDDGYQSILPAAAYMHRYDMPGDVAVIGKYVDYPTQGHLNVSQLAALQNNWGWDMVNHSQAHVDAIQEYYDRHDLSGYVSDIMQQAVWLEANGLNSAPNWFIYPHGATNAALERTVSRYYMFARGIADNPDAYPFGNREEVNDLEIQYPGDGEGGAVGYTSPRQAISAVDQAKNDHMTLILTFHRIHSQPGDAPGYPLRLFRQVVDGVRNSGIQVMTLSQLDRSDGVPVNNRISAAPARPSLITVTVGS